MSRVYERVTCPLCGYPVAAWVPRGGDGSDVKMVKHRDQLSGEVCDGSGRLAGESKASVELYRRLAAQEK